MFSGLIGYEAKRKKLLQKAPYGPLKDFLSVPFPLPKRSIVDVSLLSVDFETTGLNAATDDILSIGFVSIQQGVITLGSAEHYIVQTSKALCAENVAIHSITDSSMGQGVTIEVAVTRLLEALAGKVMLVHYAQIERRFLQKACIALFGMAPVFPIIDTLAVAKRRLNRRLVGYDPSLLRLANLRKRHQLPPHYEHNALNDAVATAELFFAEIATRDDRESVKLKSLLL